MEQKPHIPPGICRNWYGNCTEDYCDCHDDYDWIDRYDRPSTLNVVLVVLLMAVATFLAIIFLIPSHPVTIYPPDYCELDVVTCGDYDETEKVSVTAYSCEGEMTWRERMRNCPHGVTKMGTIPDPYRTIACDPSQLGQWKNIEGIGYRLCEDTGGHITGDRIDLYMESIAIAREFGKQKLKVK